MSIAVIVFPGSNCEHDVVYALEDLGAEVDLVWHRETDLSHFDGVVLPGGFAHGDYLRTGAIARFSPVMSEVRRLASEGAPILGICNGFQILTEAGLLPGVLLANRDLRFICRPVHLRVESTGSVLTRNATVGDVLEIPLNSYEGNYTGGPAAGGGTTLLTYSDTAGVVGPNTNPNGSSGNIAGIANRRGNVAGLMPHPERAVEEALGSVDGRVLLGSFATSVEEYEATRPARV
ncbi:MAG: phosphoribosylformylglycinamidine synthase subunit PurQ [Actinobacteria bacterium]|nr:phosphoribosylformylglycinamidine synthase subunit PurQ [Actinomycetota bacterium]